jgi:uncharacterized protein YhbP (UPF0306 family)
MLSCGIHADGYGQKDLQESIDSILEANKLCSMATSNGTNPYTNTAYFAYTNDLKIYFLSQPTLQHSLNIANNSAISLTVFDSSQPFASHLQGLQIFGDCILSTEQTAKLGFDLYTKRFPKLLDRVPSFEDYERGVIKSRFYEISVSSVKIFDEPRFGKDVWINTTIGNKTKILEGLISDA